MRGVGGRATVPHRHPAGPHAGGRAAQAGPPDAAGEDAHHDAGQLPGRLHRRDVLPAGQHHLVHQLEEGKRVEDHRVEGFSVVATSGLENENTVKIEIIVD